MGINQLQGGIPSDIGRCVTLKRLFLNENNFTGSLPDFESNMNLKYMDMSKQQICRAHTIRAGKPCESCDFGPFSQQLGRSIASSIVKLY